MANERPVTGSCERCARGHDLLIPEPGSGDLDLQRVVARFACCAGCGHLVGLTCCWVASADLCADCVALRATPEPSLTDAVLARNALATLSAATGEMGALERQLRRLQVTDADPARDAWEDAWLEAGAGIVRAGSAARTARRRGRAASTTPAEQQWLSDQLATRGATWVERKRAVTDRLESLGLRIRALTSTLEPPAATPAEREVVPFPVTRRLSPVTHLPTREPASVGALPPGPPTRARALAPEREAPVPRAGRPVPVAVSALPTPQPVAVAVRAAATPRPAEPRRAPDSLPLPGRKSPAQQYVPPPRAFAPPLTDARAAPARPSARRGPLRTVIILVAILAAVGAVVAAAAIERLSAAPGTSTAPAGAATSTDRTDPGAGTTPSPAGTATTSGAMTTRGATVTFDLEPLGLLATGATGIARILGTPEVAALPTPFDRSLLLAAAGSGACLAGVRGEPARSLSVDLRTGERPEGSLQITPTDRTGAGVVLELAAIPGLEAETWYRVLVDWDDEGGIRLGVRERDSGLAVNQGRVPAATTAPDRSGSGAVCVEALAVSEATALHIDNARVGS